MTVDAAPKLVPTATELALAETLVANGALSTAETATCAVIALAARAGAPVLPETLTAFLDIVRAHGP